MIGAYLQVGLDSIARRSLAKLTPHEPKSLQFLKSFYVRHSNVLTLLNLSFFSVMTKNVTVGYASPASMELIECSLLMAPTLHCKLGIIAKRNRYAD